MNYKLCEINNTGTTIPDIIIKKIETLPKSKEEYFRVALFMVSTQIFDTIIISDKLRLTKLNVEKALSFWEGAGLLIAKKDEMPVIDETKSNLTTKQVFNYVKSDENVAILLQETQSIFNSTITQPEANILVSLYKNNNLQLDYMLVGLTHFAFEGMKLKSIKSIQKRFKTWLDSGIKTVEDIENYIVLCENRKKYYSQISEILHIDENAFTYSEKNKIANWFENYAYQEPIISHSALLSGDKASVAYMNSILKKWYYKGYKNVKDVLSGEAPVNVIPTSNTILPENDIVIKGRSKVPKFNR